MEVINEWELVEVYCQTKNKSVVYFRNQILLLLLMQRSSKFGIGMQSSLMMKSLDAMKTMGTWDMVTFDNIDVAIANAGSWFPPLEDCPDSDYFWEVSRHRS